MTRRQLLILTLAAIAYVALCIFFTVKQPYVHAPDAPAASESSAP